MDAIIVKAAKEENAKAKTMAQIQAEDEERWNNRAKDHRVDQPFALEQKRKPS